MVEVLHFKSSLNHNRKIFTNYFAISCDASFKDFHKENKPHVLTVHSFSEKETHEVYQNYVNFLGRNVSITNPLFHRKS